MTLNQLLICFGNFHSTLSRAFIIFWDELSTLGNMATLKGKI